MMRFVYNREEKSADDDVDDDELMGVFQIFGD
jgi:hypothetical protein